MICLAVIAEGSLYCEVAASQNSSWSCLHKASQGETHLQFELANAQRYILCVTTCNDIHARSRL